MCSLVKRYACVRAKRLRMRDKDLTAICDRTKKKAKPEFQLGRFLWKARVITKGASVELVNQRRQLMKVFVVRKSDNCGKK